MARGGVRSADSGGGLASEVRRFHSHRRQLHRILGETQRCLKEVSHMNLFPLESAISEAVRMSREGALRPAAIVTLGPARARLVNFLLGEAVLPPSSCKGWRWLRLQHGIRKQIRLSLGPDIEVVEPNLSMDSNWDQIPDKILKRTDPMDLSTVMDIELNNPFLENSIQILVPPDLGELSLDDKTPYDFTRESTIKDYEIFYSKRGSLLQNVHPIVLYALDELGPIVPPDKRKTRIKIDPLKSKIEKIPDTSKTFLNKFKDFVIRKDDQKSNCDSVSSFYVPLKNDDDDHDVRDNGLDETDFDRIKISETKSDRKSSIDDFLNLESCCYSGLSEENFLDLRQVYELHPNSQVLFILFSDSVERTENSNPTHRLPPNLNVTSANHDGDSSASLENYSLGDSPLSASNYLNSEYGTTESSSVSPMSDYVSSKSTSILKMVKDNGEANSKSEPCITETKEELSSSVKSGESILFSMDEDKEKLLDKQKAYLSSLVEQLGLMSHPISQQKFTGHWLIVDDSNVSRSTVNGNKQKRSNKSKMAAEEETVIVGEVLQRDAFIYNLVTFSRGCLKNYVLDDCNELSEIHNALLQQFIISSFDMAREMQIVPRKIHYVAVMEQQLYDTLNEKFTGEEKKEELLGIIQRVLQEMKHNVNCIDWEGRESSCHLSEDCINRKTTSSVFYELDNRLQNGDVHHNDPDVTANGSSQPKPDLLDNITDEYLREYYVIDSNPKEMNFNNSLNAELAVEIDSAPENRNGKTNVVNLEVKVQRGNVFDVKIDVDCCKSTQVSFKQASLEIQKAVLARLSRNISIQLVSFVDCLRDSYFGTLQRCLESLEEGRGRRTASEAVRRILLVTRTVNLQQCASFSLLDALVDHLRWFFHRLSLSSGNGRSCCAASPRWRKQVALDTIESLSASRLSRIISLQLRDRIRLSHEQFQSALQALSDHHAARLQQTEELKLTVRKLHAPRFARLCLESTSLRDLVSHGIPHLAKEIGRGQYGVVYAVKGSWAGFEPCAVKSVVPPDERHFNELAMEFFHTRNIPPHDRIVSLCGSVIDHSYSEGGPAVLLVSQRLRCDLHCALLSSDLTFRQRMQIAVDIVEGIRYLHSQGLVHRDIKLKNVLLEELQPRAKITDLGFCIPEAMMSGSIVGTPVHMAPELLSGLYDSSVDVYAFGVLFWYVCAGSVKLPCAFEHFQNKEQLWCNVRKGLRPERLQCFYDSSWELMEKCWSGEPGLRPLLGDVQPILEDLRDNPSRHMNARNIGLNI